MPDGQITDLAVQSALQNIFVPTHPKSNLQLSHPTPLGAYHDRHGRGEGCGGRGSVLRATGLQGGFFESVSDQQHADENVAAYGEVVCLGERLINASGASSREVASMCLESRCRHSSCPGLTRASINLRKTMFEEDGLPGHRRAEATPSFGRLCPAMTE